MKKKLLFTFSFLMLNHTLIFSQGYLPLPDSNVVWITCSAGPSPSCQKFFTNFYRDDTLINSKQWIKLYAEYNTMTGTDYLGSYRSDTSGKTLFVPKDSTGEYLLMDISKQFGDTIKQIFIGFPQPISFPGVSDYYVDSTSHVTDGPYLLKTLFLHEIGASSCFSQYLIWVEKIGCIGGGIFNKECGACGVDLGLTCMSFNDSIYYDYYGCFWPNISSTSFSYRLGQCTLPLGVSSLTLSNSIKITPNPFNDIITINNLPPNGNVVIQVMNLQGKSILKTQSSEAISLSLNLKDLSSGMYFLRIYNQSTSIMFNEKIIKL